nr:YezD family protein [Virgibacillus phasianinus]
MTKKDQQENSITSKINDMLSTMEYGSITLIVQDGKVIQLEKNEKVRIR